jgi:hypothetical protein
MGRRAVIVVVMLTTVSGCGSGDDDGAAAPTTAPVIDPGDGGQYAPEIDAASFSSTVDNPFLPFLPGAKWVYEGRAEDGETETITVEVLDERRVVMGVETIVVHDVVTVEGEVIEDTFDWFAQDADGTVWYFGEDTTSYEDGEASTEGAWEAGVDGALPGVVMWADLDVTGTGYRQEYLPGEAEDMGQVIATEGSVSTPYGDFTDVMVTRDWTPLEPDVVEQKTYARGIGLVHEEKVDRSEVVELVEFTPGAAG